MVKYLATGFVLLNLIQKAKAAVADKVSFAMLKPKKGDIHLLRERFNIRIKVINDMGIVIPVSAIKGKLIQDDKVLGHFSTDRINDVPAHSTKEISLDGKIVSENILSELARVLMHFGAPSTRPYLSPITFKGHVYVDSKVFPVEKVYQLF